MKKRMIGFLVALCLLGTGSLMAEETDSINRIPNSGFYITLDGMESETDTTIAEEDASSLQLHPLINFYVGDNSVPLGRSYLTDPNGQMTIDQPYFATPQFFQNLTKKGIVPLRLQSSEGETHSSDTPMTDRGTTVFGLASMAENLHLKYYLGLYDGAENVNENTNRLSGRVQVNLMDPEPGYHQQSSYAGGKKTIGMGISFDGQKEIASENVNEMLDYKWYEFDAFADMPVGRGVLTMEMAFQKMRILFTDLEEMDEEMSMLRETRQNDGNGWHFQTGYLIDDLQLQPWAAYETWAVTDNDGKDIDGYDRWKVGVTYFLRENMGNIKAGFEKFKTMPTEEVENTDDDSVNSFLLNFTINF